MSSGSTHSSGHGFRRRTSTRLVAARRLAGLVRESSRAAASWFLRRARHQAPLDLPRRALWLHHSSQRTLKAIDIGFTTVGLPPAQGFLIANHLSYVDILVLSAAVPCVFVAKSEVRAWPVFGLLASLAGTIFVDRTRRSDVARVNDELRRAIAQNILLVIFPEGTSSDGRQVLPFKSSLLEVVAGNERPLSVAAIDYTLSEGDPGQSVCYWGDMVFLPHLLNLLHQPQVHALIRFAPVPSPEPDRKVLARQLHSEVTRLKFPQLAATAQAPSVPAT